MVDAAMSIWESFGYNVQTMGLGIGIFLFGFVFCKLVSIGRKGN